MSFGELFKLQDELQRVMPAGRPAELRGDARAAFIREMALAACDEIHEAINETGWKTWASSRHVNADAMGKELVDALFFVSNLFLVVAAELGVSPAEYGDRVMGMYREKLAVNYARQRDGYDGVSSKCHRCKRDLGECDPTLARSTVRDGVTLKVCSPRCLIHV